MKLLFWCVGRDFEPDRVLSVATQVERLVQEATSVKNLCEHFHGWWDRRLLVFEFATDYVNDFVLGVHFGDWNEYSPVVITGTVPRFNSNKILSLLVLLATASLQNEPIRKLLHNLSNL